MRFFHLADLHIGKRLKDFSLLKDQKHILQQIIELAGKHRPDAVLICGDIYDKSDPSAEAVEIFDRFLTELTQYQMPVMIISGNHDSPERLSFGSRILDKQKIYIAGSFCGTMPEVTLMDSYGQVVFHLLPFVKPAVVKRYFPDAEINSYEDALRSILAAVTLDPEKRHVLLAHQFVTSHGIGPSRSDSEYITVGTLDNIDASLFAGFDYVALGHIHGPQAIGAPHIRYAGSPLKYSFSEALHQKSVSLVELADNGEPQIELLELQPLHDVREIRGPIEQLLSPEVYQQADRNDYLHISLTNEEDLVDPIVSLRNVYPNLINMDFANSRYAAPENAADPVDIHNKSPWELFSDFYAMQQNIELDEQKQHIIKSILQELEGNN